jgi:cyclin C
MAANFWASSHCQVWQKEPKEEDLSEDDKRRVGERNRRNAEIFGPDCMDEDIKRLRVHLVAFMTQLARSKQVNVHMGTGAVRQRVVSTAMVYVHRFYYYNSYKDFHPYLIAATAFYLASKVEEQPVQPKNISTALQSAAPGYGSGSAPGRVASSNRFYFTGADIVDAEYYLVEELRFNLIVFHPYRPMEKYIRELRLERYQQDAHNMINDSYRTDACLYYPPHAIAIAVLIMTAIYHGQDFRPWYDSMQFHDNHRAQIGQVQQVMLTLYDDYSCIQQAEVDKILDKIPKHDSVSQVPSSSNLPSMHPP